MVIKSGRHGTSVAGCCFDIYGEVYRLHLLLLAVTTLLRDNADMLKPSLMASLLDSRTRFRVQIKHAVAIGPGKADVLRAILETGSIAETGRRLGMSYQRVWTLVRAMNQDFVEPLVVTQRGGRAGGGASLTPVGERVLTVYLQIARDAERAVAKRLPNLLALISPAAQDTPRQSKVS